MPRVAIEIGDPKPQEILNSRQFITGSWSGNLLEELERNILRLLDTQAEEQIEFNQTPDFDPFAMQEVVNRWITQNEEARRAILANYHVLEKVFPTLNHDYPEVVPVLVEILQS